MAGLYRTDQESEAAIRDDKELREMACLDMPVCEFD